MYLTASSEALSGVASSAGRRMVTGNIRPLPSTRGASRSLQRDRVSIVADIRTSRRSGRRICRASRVMARATSEGRLRSWNSSKITAETPSRAGSSTSRRTRMPSVSTSMRVRSETQESKRIRYPIVCPTGSPSRAAMREAICRAASRRGSSMRILLPAGRSCRIVRGRRVDLPAPGGAETTTVPRSRRAWFTLSAIPAAGRRSPSGGMRKAYSMSERHVHPQDRHPFVESSVCFNVFKIKFFP